MGLQLGKGPVKSSLSREKAWHPMDRRGHPAEDNRALKLSAAPWLSGWPAASHQPGPRGLPFQKGDLRAIEGLIAPGRLGCHVDKAEESSWRHRRRVSWLLRVVQVRALVTEAETHTEPLSLLHLLPKHPPVPTGCRAHAQPQTKQPVWKAS